MGSGARRFFLVVGVTLFTGGWGLTKYADVQQTAIASGKSESLTLWTGKSTKPKTYASKARFSGKHLFAAGIIGMSLGAMLTVSLWPRQ